MSEVLTSGDWREERLYVLKTIEELKHEQQRQAQTAAIERTAVIEKGTRDIKAAHDKIRKLESSGHELRIKNWIVTALLSCAAAVAFEFIRAWIHK